MPPIKKSSSKIHHPMPPEHFRRCFVTTHGISHIHLLPSSIHSWFQSIPMPWEGIRYVKVYYHVKGNYILIDSKRKEKREDYEKKWSSVLIDYIQSDVIGNYPVFDDDEEFVDYESVKSNVPDQFNGSNVNIFESIGRNIRENTSGNVRKSITEFPLIPTGTKKRRNNKRIKRNLEDINSKDNSTNKDNSNITNINTISGNVSVRSIQCTTSDWLEVSLALLKLGRSSLTNLLHAKKVTKLQLDYNFNLRPIKTLTISKGVKNGDQIVYKKLGNQFPGCVPGDIVFSIKVEDRPDYQRNGDDFICPVEIDILTALTGGVVYYDHPDGRKLAIKVQPFKDFESSLFIPSEVFTNTKTSKKGNLYLKPKVKVKIPFFA